LWRPSCHLWVRPGKRRAENMAGCAVRADLELSSSISRVTIFSRPGSVARSEIIFSSFLLSTIALRRRPPTRRRFIARLERAWRKGAWRQGAWRKDALARTRPIEYWWLVRAGWASPALPAPRQKPGARPVLILDAGMELGGLNSPPGKRLWRPSESRPDAASYPPIAGAGGVRTNLA